MIWSHTQHSNSSGTRTQRCVFKPPCAWTWVSLFSSWSFFSVTIVIFTLLRRSMRSNRASLPVNVMPTKWWLLTLIESFYKVKYYETEQYTLLWLKWKCFAHQAHHVHQQTMKEASTTLCTHKSCPWWCQHSFSPLTKLQSTINWAINTSVHHKGGSSQCPEGGGNSCNGYMQRLRNTNPVVSNKIIPHLDQQRISSSPEKTFTTPSIHLTRIFQQDTLRKGRL